MRIHALAVAAVAATAFVPATASAVTADRSASVDATTPKFEWDSKPGTGFTTLTSNHDTVPCNTPGAHTCDYTLIHVTGCGTLAVTNTGTLPTAVDTDLYTYYADKDGNVVAAGPSSAQSTPTPDEQTVVDVPDQDSWILVETDYTDSIDPGGAVHGTATFTPADPETAADFCTPVAA